MKHTSSSKTDPGKPTKPTDPHPAEPQLPQGIGIFALQRLIGNQAIRAIIERKENPLPPHTELPHFPVLKAHPTLVQLQPDTIKDKPHTYTWEHEESHQGRTTMLRTTKIESDAWGEVGPMPPRIKYRRTVEMQTPEGVKVYLDIRGTVYLQEGTELPATPEAALAKAGLLVRNHHELKVEGGDFVPVHEYKPRELPGQSMLGSTTNFPDYAQLDLTVEKQAEAILRHLGTLKRREKEKTEDEDSIVDTAIATGTDFLPIVGELKDAYRAITGKDPDTGKPLAWWERIMSGVFAIPFVGKIFKGIGKGIKGLIKGGKWLGDKLGRLKRWIGSKWPRKKKKLGSTGDDVGKLAAKKLSRLKEVFDNPAVLAGKTPNDVGHMFSPQHWDIAPQTGRSPGTKYTLKNEQGKVTGQIQVRWSSGQTGRHFRDAAGVGQPYWQIAVANGKPPHIWVGPDGKMFSKPPTYKGGAINQTDPPVEWKGSIQLPSEIEKFLGL